MNWTFQAYFRIPYSSLRGSNPEFLVFQDDTDGERISICSADKVKPLEQATLFALKGAGYPSREHAEERGNHWLVAAKRAFAETHLGGDFQEIQPACQVSPALADSMGKFGLEQIRRGVVTFPSDAEPNFAHRSGVGIVKRDMDVLRQALITHGDRQSALTPAQALAHSLYAASFHETTPESGLLVLTSALEALVKPGRRGDNVDAFVARALELAKQTDLGEDRDSVLNSIRDLRRRSIRQACLDLLEELDLPVSRQSPRQVFNVAYSVRSRLIHGDESQPSPSEVRDALHPMWRLVGDVLARV